MKAWSWVIVAAGGFAMMLAAFVNRPRPDPNAPWAQGFVIVGPDAASRNGLPGEIIKARLRLLPAGEFTDGIIKGASLSLKDQTFALEARLRPKLIVVSLDDAGIDAKWLESGHLPKADADEVLAGSRADQKGQLKVGDRVLEVTGVLKPDVALFVESYLVPPSAQADALTPPKEPSVHDAALVQLSPEQSRDRRILEELDKAIPAPTYVRLEPSERLDPQTFYLYLAGQALFLLGGSGVLIRLYRGWADRLGWGKPDLSPVLAPESAELPGETPAETTARGRRPFLATPLFELRQRPGLVWTVHLVYFGLVIVWSLFVYEVPQIQAVLLAAVQSAFTVSNNPLAVAGAAYASGNVLRAAGVTFAVNFFLGSLAVLTLPSLVLPGSGSLVAALRATVWGLLLAPTFVTNAFSMLPHSGTLLLEGEGYILATLFGLLIPIYIFQSSLGGSPLSRFGRALMLNLKGNVLVALVLAVAALYEAIEVIAMMKMAR